MADPKQALIRRKAPGKRRTPAALGKNGSTKRLPPGLAKRASGARSARAFAPGQVMKGTGSAPVPPRQILPPASAPRPTTATPVSSTMPYSGAPAFRPPVGGRALPARQLPVPPKGVGRRPGRRPGKSTGSGGR
jgi:hypothetical protein